MEIDKLIHTIQNIRYFTNWHVWIYIYYVTSIPESRLQHGNSKAVVQTLKRHTHIHLPSLYALGEIQWPSWRAVQMISQAREVCNVCPSALVFSRLCDCTIMFTLGPETPHNSIRDDCTSAKKRSVKT